jgi:hypothetical protein
MYIEVTQYDWFYIEFFNNTVTITSTDKDFNDLIRDKFAEVQAPDYTIRLGTTKTVSRFVDRFDDLDSE